MKKDKWYLRFWWFARYFTGFWILYGCFILIKSLVIEATFNLQALALAIGMLILFSQSRKEYIKFKK